MEIKEILDKIVAVEGNYSDHPSDPGGKTMYGITERVARANGYSGEMRNLSRHGAITIYQNMYVMKPNFDQVHAIYPKLGHELIDCGVNLGVSRATRFLQIALNAFNARQSHYADVAVDGVVGGGTLQALRAYKKRRGDEGELVMCRACDVQQGAHYLNLAGNNTKFEDFQYGWFRTRIG